MPDSLDPNLEVPDDLSGLEPDDRRPPRHGGSVLMAAMLGLAHAMGREPEPIDVVEVADAELGVDELRLTFGDLRPLDWRDEA